MYKPSSSKIMHHMKFLLLIILAALYCSNYNYIFFDIYVQTHLKN